MKGLKKGLGIYLILFFAMFCGIIWYMNKSSKTDSGYTIVDTQQKFLVRLLNIFRSTVRFTKT